MVEVTPDTLLSVVVEVAGGNVVEPVIDGTIVVLSMPPVESEVAAASVVMTPSVLEGTPESAE
jgi:hypothetical protein